MEKTKKTDIIFNIIAIISIAIFAFAISPKTLQNDTFYTIKIGEYILNNGITMHDPFSWHNISYTFPHWAYDVMIYLIYSIGGQLGIYLSTIIMAAILGLVIYFSGVKLTKNKPISFGLTIAGMFLLQGYIAARAQLFTFILFALESFLIERLLETNKKRYGFGLFVIAVLLANFHVAVFPFYFIVFLPYIAEYIIAWLASLDKKLVTKKIDKTTKKLELNKDEKKQKALEKRLEELERKQENIQKRENKEPYKIKITYRKSTKLLIIVMIIAVFAGLITPLGDVPYTYLVKTMQGNSTQNISEHLPLTLFNDINFACVLIFFLAILMFTDTKIRLCDLFMLGGLTALTFMSRRQESMFVILCIPIFNRLVTDFFNKYDKTGIEKLTKMMTSLCGAIITVGLVIIISLMSFNNKIGTPYIDETKYPVEATEWILNNLNSENVKLYNEYNFGSYLLFKGVPVFIDSRCDLYMPEFNEGVDVFNDFLTISGLKTKNLEGLFNKYGFTHFITYSNSKLTIYLEAKPEEFKKIYADDNFCIYERMPNAY